MLSLCGYKYLADLWAASEGIVWPSWIGKNDQINVTAEENQHYLKEDTNDFWIYHKHTETELLDLSYVVFRKDVNTNYLEQSLTRKPVTVAFDHMLVCIHITWVEPRPISTLRSNAYLCLLI